MEEESAYIPGWDRYSLHADHFSPNKYSGPNDQSFKDGSNRIEEICVRARDTLESRAPSKSVIIKVTWNNASRLEALAKSHFMVPFGRNESFVRRDSFLHPLLKRIPLGANNDDCQHTIIMGLGSVGKTQIALEAAYPIRDFHPKCSVFWIPVIGANTFENAYREIGKLLGAVGINNDEANIKTLIKSALNQDSAGEWLSVIDNADDLELLFGSASMSKYLPFNRNSLILVTSRNHEGIVRPSIRNRGIIIAPEMNRAGSLKLLTGRL